MTLTPLDFFTIFIFVAISYGLINLLKVGLGQLLRWDIGEKERILQQRLADLSRQCDQYKEEVSDLRKQVKILLGQYDEAVVRLSALKNQYDAAMEEIKKLRDELDREKEGVVVVSPDRGFNRILIAAVGSVDPGFGMDIASLWAVNTETGLEFEKIEATAEKLTESLDRARGKKTITYLHLAARSDANGYQLLDRIVDANWLASILQGVIIMVVAGSDSSTVGDLLGVVPYVITMNDKISSREAAQFARSFWGEVGRGLGPTLAVQRALERAPARMKPYVTRHWMD